MDELRKAIEKMEEPQEPEGPVGEDITIIVQHYRTILEENGDRREVLVPADGYDEGEWSDAGNGRRMRVRRPKYTRSRLSPS